MVSPLEPPSLSRALPLQVLLHAVPKYISRRTSYHCIRLAFHSYPQVIGRTCNSNPFGPPAWFLIPSTCSWVAHTVSGLSPATSRPIQTRFRFGSKTKFLNLATDDNSLAHSTIGTWSPEGSHSIVGLGFHDLFTPFPRVLFTFPSRYYSLSV